MEDLATYGWIVQFAENILDQEEDVANALKKGR